MYVYYRGAFRNRYSLFSENAQSQTLDMVLWSTSVLPGVFIRIFILIYSFLHRLHLQEMLSHDSLKCLKERRLWADFTLAGRLFQIFGPKSLKLLSPYLTWLGLVTLRFKTFSFLTGFFESDYFSHKSWIKTINCLVHFYTQTTQTYYCHWAFLCFA